MIPIVTPQQMAAVDAAAPEPVEVLIESNQNRLEDLVALRYARMSASPFTFLRVRCGLQNFIMIARPS